MVGESLGWFPWGGDYKDEVKEGSDNWGYSTAGFPQPSFAVDTFYDRDYPGNYWPAYELIYRLNDNANIVNHVGHASVDYCMRMYNADADALTNGKCFFGWTQGCYAGSFDNRWSDCSYGSADCILEHFVVADHGAFAFIGNSRYGWGNAYTTDGASQRFDREFWDAVFGEGIIRIGIGNADSKEDNAGLIGDDYIRFCYYEINLLGDPTVSIMVGATKPPEIVSFAPSSPVNDTVCNCRTFNVTVDQTVNVSWYLNGSFLFMNGSVQEANCTLHAEVAGEHNVSAIASNANGTDMQTWVWSIPSPCFIATAAYGTPLHDDIAVLRAFRDEYLMQNPFGRSFVKIYYSTSPPIADLVRDNDGLRLIVRGGVGQDFGLCCEKVRGLIYLYLTI